MVTVTCPACQQPMDIENVDPGTEWECPECAAAFLVERGDGDVPRFVILEPARREGRDDRPKLIATTGNDVARREIASYLGMVRGIVVRSPSIAQGFLGGLQRIVGGNIEAYTQVCEAARREAYQLMLEHAREMGADAIIGVRYDATEFAEGVTEVLAYGTAVTLMPPPPV